MSLEIKGILNYDPQTGLSISSRGEILNDLESLTKIAYGPDYVIEQGNEWYSFLDILAGSLAELAGVCQDIYASLSFNGAAGVPLDNVVSYAGIIRKPKSNSTVEVVVTVPPAVAAVTTYPIGILSGNIYIEDPNGNVWTNKEDLYILNNTISKKTVLFEAINSNPNPTNIQVDAYTTFTLQSGCMYGVGFEYENQLPSKLGREEEDDAQLRARYAAENYRRSTGTIEGVKAKIIEETGVKYCYIRENSTAGTVEGMTPHSIWVVVDGNSTWDGTGTVSNYVGDLEIARAILEYKSLGCGTSVPTEHRSYNSAEGTGMIRCDITIGSDDYVVFFSRAEAVPCRVIVDMSTTLPDENERQSAELLIKQNIAAYINGLGIGNDVLSSGVYSQIFAVISDRNYKDFIMDVTNLSILRTGGSVVTRIPIDANEFANISESDITVNWTMVE